MKTQTVQMNFAEKALVSMIAVVWRMLRLLDPYRIQRYFAAKVNVLGSTISKLYSLSGDDAKDHICRINNNRMKEGEHFLAKRGDLLKVYNPMNGKFVFRFVHGAGELPIRLNELGLDYDAKLELGVLKDEEVDLQVMKANTADREFYLMYRDRSVSSRQSRALGWYMLLGSLLFGLLSQVFGLIVALSAAIH
ncbi:hypothetical protein [Pseudomonas sp. MWU12-2323]|uniref:hypothetical protein n=1 Tax=Pseudomonas sp. MWU12-2323 TaxID=2651296 RepID=UPI00128D95B5|nr:hypothetical protein [Pseudomonas sp. MWU12-2323]MPQ69284.1 hypothetical protein [Pseudomonas sp. MWU12-2323]